MKLEPITEFLLQIRNRLYRSEWRQFSDIVIHADESVVKKHGLYAAAKAGDIQAAQGLILETATLAGVEKICELMADKQPFLLPVHAVEAEGRNPIPLVLAQMLSKMLNLPLDTAVVQINTVSHTGADGFTRLAFPALFDGIVQPSEYFLVDDFIGQGGTIANLKGFLESHGAQVIGATTLTGKAYSAKLQLREETLEALRKKHGSELEDWWLDAFGYGFTRLTESEARYLSRADDAYSITTRIVAARRQRDHRLP